MKTRRLSNSAEAQCAKQLRDQGYYVTKRGWPDFIAIKEDSVRLIEVKPTKNRHLSPSQHRVARALHRAFGIHVERWSPDGPFLPGLSNRAKRKAAHRDEP